MAISKENKDFIHSLVDYYINEAQSYQQIAEEYVPDINEVNDTAFGIIVGCIYSGFLQAYSNQQLTASLDDIKEFNSILKERAPFIKEAILGKKIEEELEKETSF